MTGISTIICCYNSANRIEPTLEHLINQSIDKSLHEIIVVDNNCTDNTVSICQRILNGFDYTIIAEKNPGLSSARIAGARIAKYPIIAFVDDDNWLSRDYLSNSLSYFQDESIGMIGGIGFPISDIPFPNWFDKFQHQYAVGEQASHTGKLEMDAYVYGAGQVLRKKLLLEVLKMGIRFSTSDRIGGKLISGGDVELNNWIKLQGYDIHYYDNLSFNHYIPKSRLNWDYLIAINKQSGPSNMASVAMYFLDRDPDISAKRLRYRYYKRLLWLFSQYIKHIRFSIGTHEGKPKKLVLIRAKSNLSYGLFRYSVCKNIFNDYIKIKEK